MNYAYTLALILPLIFAVLTLADYYTRRQDERNRTKADRLRHASRAWLESQYNRKR